jgi:cytochrome c-type biogenesis protein CcsB
MGTIHVLYNNRICPLNTVATDFTMKLTGSASWHGYSADEVFFSWMIYYDPWERSLGPTPSPSRGEGDKNSKEQKRAEERQAVVEMFYNGQFTKIFPYKLTPTTEEATTPLSRRSGAGGEAGEAGTIAWYSPGGQVLPREIPVKEQFFIKQSMDFLTEAIVTGQHDRAVEIIAKIKLFQHEMAGDVLPSTTKTKAEIFYNKLRGIKFPVLITLQLGLRWWLSGHIPLSNGYETMLFMAWVLLVLTIVLFRKIRIILFIGPLAALCCLLVAMMTGSGSEITPLMPVLQSPLLSLHVMTVMCAYALFALQMLLGIYALFLIRKRAQPNCQLSIINCQLEKATALSQLLLYPAVFLLTIGIFLGAVWANVSWGNYWSWDPKESWALITLMVYAVPLHKTTVGAFQRPRFYHLYMVVSFLAVLITYFGVNFLLGGMHSYA